MRQAGLAPLGKLDVEGYELDFAFITDAVRVNVEVDGDQHLDDFGRSRRQDLVRDRILQRAGWKVLRVLAWRCVAEPAVAAGEVSRALVGPVSARQGMSLREVGEPIPHSRGS